MITAVLLLTAVTCATPSSPAVTGFWESDTSRGGIGQTLELKPDGSANVSVVIIVSQLYRTADGKLFIAEDANGLKAPANSAPFSVTSTTLVQKNAEGHEVPKERVGPLPASGVPLLVGVWRYRHYTGAIAFERYTVDGHFLFRLPLTSHQGCYRVAGTSLSLEMVESSNKMQYTVSGDTLTLSREGGKSTTYHRGEPWYPRDKIDYKPPPDNKQKPDA